VSHDPVRVAVVDDEEIVRHAIARLLRSFGFDVRSYANGDEFLAAGLESPPDCVVLDVHMPGLDGFGVLAALAKRDHGLPVVLMTGYDTPENRERAMVAKVGAYLRKPVDESDLVKSIRDAIAADRSAEC